VWFAVGSDLENTHSHQDVACVEVDIQAVLEDELSFDEH
jgi:hypothetical protein